jgi:hypothetical protein
MSGLIMIVVAQSNTYFDVLVQAGPGYEHALIAICE